MATKKQAGTGPGRGSKARYTDRQKEKAAAIEASYRARGVGVAEAARRAWATVNKQDHGGRKSGSGRGTVPAAPALRKGSHVTWKWGAGTALGQIVQLFRRKLTKTIKGAPITRNADPTHPAALVKTRDGKTALKSRDELKRAPRKTPGKAPRKTSGKRAAGSGAAKKRRS